MQFEYTDHEYRTECLDGCGAVTAWMQSRMVADQAGKNHETAEFHRWTVTQRMKQEDGDQPLNIDRGVFSSRS